VHGPEEPGHPKMRCTAYQGLQYVRRRVDVTAERGAPPAASATAVVTMTMAVPARPGSRPVSQLGFELRNFKVRQGPRAQREGKHRG
jgi:hypothetical protein